MKPILLRLDMLLALCSPLIMYQVCMKIIDVKSGLMAPSTTALRCALVFGRPLTIPPYIRNCDGLVHASGSNQSKGVGTDVVKMTC